MIDQIPSPLLSTGLLSGILAHALIFRKGEWDTSSISVFLTYGSLSIAAVALQRLKFVGELDLDLPKAWGIELLMYHIIGLLGSMYIYRAFFHRLNMFPGPFWARLSSLYATRLSAKKFQLFKETARLHEKYGDYVRLGQIPSLLLCICCCLRALALF